MHLAVTYVAVADDRIVGFAPSLDRRSNEGTYPALGCANACQATRSQCCTWHASASTRAQGMGIGKALLRHVLRLAIEQRDHSGCVGVFTDAKPEAVSFYEALGLVPLDGVMEGLLAGEPIPMFLAMGTVAALVEG